MKLSLGHCDKLSLKSDFAYVRENGRKYTAPLLVAVLAKPTGSEVKCGVVCGRKFSLKAVERNRARRLLWESFRLLKPEILPVRMILIPRRRLLDCGTPDAMRQLRGLLKEARCFKTEAGQSK